MAFGLATAAAAARPVFIGGSAVTLAAPGAPVSLASSSNALAIDLYQALREQRPGNLAFSPASLSIALTLAWAGARGETASEMAKVLHLTGRPEEVLGSAGALLKQINDPARTAYTLRVANRLYPEKTYALEKVYVDRMAALGAPVELLDFQRAPEPSRRHINEWVAKETANRIRDLLPAGSLDAESRLVLVNALYLLADWLSPFSHSATRPIPFYPTPTAPHDVPTMQQTASFPFTATEGLKVLEMPYAGGDLAMVVVLPDRRDGLLSVERRLDAARLAAWTAALKPERVAVALPRFTVDAASPLALSSELRTMGMGAAFDRFRANFTGIAAPPRPDDRPVLSNVFHKAFVKVDEKGTEAAAATALQFQRVGAALVTERPKEFRADHPFLFLIRDRRSGLVLFLGRVTDPAAP
jgi:serpin B